VHHQSVRPRARLLTDEDLYRVHERLVELFAARELHFDGAYYCPHAPDEPCEMPQAVARVAAGRRR